MSAIVQVSVLVLASVFHGLRTYHPGEVAEMPEDVAKKRAAEKPPKVKLNPTDLDIETFRASLEKPKPREPETPPEGAGGDPPQDPPSDPPPEAPAADPPQEAVASTGGRRGGRRNQATA